jgi:hypothetical protein
VASHHDRPPSRTPPTCASRSRPPEVELPGDDLTAPLTAESTADAWLAHPEAAPWLRDQLAGAEFGRLMFHPRKGQMLRAVELLRLSRQPGFPVPEHAVTEAVTRFGSAQPAAGVPAIDQRGGVSR